MLRGVHVVQNYAVVTKSALALPSTAYAGVTKCDNPHTQKWHDGMEERNEDVDFDEKWDDEHIRDVGNGNKP